MKSAVDMDPKLKNLDDEVTELATKLMREDKAIEALGNDDLQRLVARFHIIEPMQEENKNLSQRLIALYDRQLEQSQRLPKKQTRKIKQQFEAED